MSIPEVIEKYEKKKKRPDDPLQIGEKRYLELEKPYIFFNHSCDPNAAVVGRAKIVAVKNIQKGEEILFDYSTTEWVDDSFGQYKEWTVKCNCGIRLCRKEIKEFPLLPNSLQRKYINKKMVQDFILKKYKFLHSIRNKHK